MSPFDCYLAVWKNFANFSGRASRREYWYFALFNALIVFALAIVDEALFGNPAFRILYLVAVFVPSIAVGVRRMHDVDKSGWFGLIPLYNLYLAVQPGTPGPNRFGDPGFGTPLSEGTEVPAERNRELGIFAVLVGLILIGVSVHQSGQVRRQQAGKKGGPGIEAKKHVMVSSDPVHNAECNQGHSEFDFPLYAFDVSNYSGYTVTKVGFSVYGGIPGRSTVYNLNNNAVSDLIVGSSQTKLECIALPNWPDGASLVVYAKVNWVEFSNGFTTCVVSNDETETTC